jgi:hypothetical protein
MVGRDDYRPGWRDVLAADPAHPEVRQEERHQRAAGDPVLDRVDPGFTRARV